MTLRLTLAGLAGLALAAAALPASAGTLACPSGTSCKATEMKWTPTCKEPAEVTVKTDTPKDYNDSVARVNNYQNDVKTYLSCVVDEANKDLHGVQDNVSAVNKGAQDKYQTKFKTIQDQMNEAGSKFAKAKK